MPARKCARAHDSPMCVPQDLAPDKTDGSVRPCRMIRAGTCGEEHGVDGVDALVEVDQVRVLVLHALDGEDEVGDDEGERHEVEGRGLPHLLQARLLPKFTPR